MAEDTDLEGLDDDIAAAMRRARDKTNAQLRDEQAKVLPLSAAQLHDMLPSKADKVQLEALLAIVNSAASDNAKMAALRANIEDLSGVVLNVLTKVLAVV